MKIAKTYGGIALIGAMLFFLAMLPVQAQGGAGEVNLLSWGAGAVVVAEPTSFSEHGQWSAEVLLDELPRTGWATKKGDVTPKVFVFELGDKSQITSLGFDTAQVESPEMGAKDVNLPAFGFSTTYITAGTAKVRGSRASQQYLWVELWVGKPRRQPSYCIYGVKLYNCIHDLPPSHSPSE
jgi:hypothetical protein